MPTDTEYPKGMRAIVMNAGIAICGALQSMSVTWVIMRNPTKTSAVEAASVGTSSTRGARKVDRRKRTPVTTDARPVRAPSATPEADST